MFTRIYSGIFLSVLLASVLSYGLYSFSYETRHLKYETRSLSGALQLVADSMALRAPQVRQRYLEIAAQLLGAEFINRGSILWSGLSGEQRDRLKSGAPVSLATPDNSVRWLLSPDAEALVELRVRAITEQQFRGHALLLVAEMSRRDAPMDLQQLQPYSAFPLSVHDKQQQGLDAQQRSRLRKGSAVVVYEVEEGRAFNVYVYWREGQVLRLGPVELFESLPLTVALGMLLITIFVIVSMTYWLVSRLERRLNVVSTMVNEFGEGNLRARVELGSGDRIAGLGVKINAMAERIQALLQSQREIMQAVSHELRTPLSRIRFRLQMMDDELQDLGVTLKSDAIRGDIDQLEQLIGEVLEHHQLMHQPQLLKSAMDLTKPLQEVVDNQSVLYPSVSIEVRQHTQDLLRAHSVSVYRLLQNLLSNACQHASSKVVVTVHLSGQDYAILVEDDGSGIPEQEREKVFEAFYRLDTSRNQQTGGYGLGLAIVKRIVDLHQGQIHLRSSDLGGACFVVFLPHISRAKGGESEGQCR